MGLKCSHQEGLGNTTLLHQQKVCLQPLPANLPALSACRDGLLFDFREGRLPRGVNIKTARHGLLRRGVNYMLLVEPLEVGGTNRATLAFLC